LGRERPDIAMPGGPLPQPEYLSAGPDPPTRMQQFLASLDRDFLGNSLAK
jgi:hypothetical protein